VATPVPDSQEATPERDAPPRQRLKGLCQALLELPRPVRLRLRYRLDELAWVLAVDASLWPESTALRLAGLEWRDSRVAAEALLALAAETREEPLFAPTLAAAVAAAVGHPSAEWQPEALLEVADRLTPEAPLTALALVSAAGQRLHWREEVARRLRALRHHPRPPVRAAARATLTATE
jgi:hypothetical protein